MKMPDRWRRLLFLGKMRLKPHPITADTRLALFGASVPGLTLAMPT